MTFERILSHFQVRKRGTGKAQCICPAHADREASLTLTDGNDRALIKCHAGCSTEEVVIAAGLKMSDLFYGDGLAKERWRAYIENREKRKIEAVYNYACIFFGLFSWDCRCNYTGHCRNGYAYEENDLLMSQ